MRYQVGEQLLDAAAGQTRAADRDRAREEKAALMAAPLVSEESAKDKKGKKGKKGKAAEGASKAEVTLSGNKLLLIDLDTKLLVLARNLKKRKQAFLVRMRDYHTQVAAVERHLQGQRELERARQLVSGDGVPSSGVVDVTTEVPDMQTMLLPKMPRFRMLLMHEETLALIVEALLGTADRVSQGLPVDANNSIQKAHRDVLKEGGQKDRKSLVAGK